MRNFFHPLISLQRTHCPGRHKIRPDTVTFAGYALHLYIAKCLDPDFGDFPDKEIENIDEVRQYQFDVLGEIVLEAQQKISLHSDVLSWMLMTDIPPIDHFTAV